MSGYVGDLSEKQKEALTNLRNRINDVITPRCDDQFLLRFLRARDWDLDKTEKKLRLALEFRKKWGADTILEDWTPPPLCVQYFPTGFTGTFDSTGHPVAIYTFGSADLKGLMKCHSRDELIKFKIWEQEKTEREMAEFSQQQGRRIEKLTAILDMQGLSSYHLWGPGLALFGEMMEIEEKFYPETTNKGFIIRAPRIFPTIYSLVKPFIDPNTREKLEILASGYKDRLIDYIGAENLPEMYGGKLKEIPHVVLGGKIPKDLYKENDESLQHQYVKPGKTFIVEVEAQIGQELTWEFVTENHDIGFGIFLQQGSKQVEVLPSERTAAHLGNVEGSLTLQKQGTYLLVWDNSFSWTRGKNLKYRFELTPGN